ncbi:MAG: hypothetical protein AAGI68_06730 [Planctomycetota bacterium]
MGLRAVRAGICGLAVLWGVVFGTGAASGGEPKLFDPWLKWDAGVGRVMGPGYAGRDDMFCPLGRVHQFAWPYWFETRLDGLVVEASPRMVFGASDRVDAETVERVRVWLLGEARGDQPKATRGSRAAALVALGRMGPEERTMGLLLGVPGETARGLIEATDQRIASSAMVGLGLTGDGSALAGLTGLELPEGKRGRPELSRLGRLVAMGLLPMDQEGVSEALIAGWRGAMTWEEARMAAWGLTRHRSRAGDRLLAAAITKVESPYVVQEALLGLEVGSVQGSDHVLMRWAADRPRPSARAEALTQEMTVRRTNHLNGISPGVQPLWRPVPAETRTAALLALASAPTAGDQPPGSRVGRELERWSAYTTRNGFNDFFRGPAWLARVRHSEEINLDEWEWAMRGGVMAWDLVTQPDGSREHDWAERTVPDHYGRDYVLLAAGLYINRVFGGEGSAGSASLGLRPHERERVARRLSAELRRIVLDRRAHRLTRAAAALGLGLSGQSGLADGLAETLSRVKRDEALILASGALALAMMDDPRGVTLGRKLLKTGGRGLESEAAFAERLAVLAVLRSGAEADVVWLAANPPAQRLALPLWARVLHRHGYTRSAVVGVLERLEDGSWEGTPAERAMAVRVLGQLLDVSERSPLRDLVEDTNYSMSFRAAPLGPPCPNNPQPLTLQQQFPLLHFHAVAGPYLYGHLRRPR